MAAETIAQERAKSTAHVRDIASLSKTGKTMTEVLRGLLAKEREASELSVTTVHGEEV